MLASSSVDFRDGIIFCEIIQHLQKSKLSGIIYEGESTNEKSLHNILLALNVLKSLSKASLPEKISKLTPEMVYGSEDVMFQLLEYLNFLFESQVSNPAKDHILIKKSIDINRDPANLSIRKANSPTFPENKISFPLSTRPVSELIQIKDNQQQQKKNNVTTTRRDNKTFSIRSNEDKNNQLTIIKYKIIEWLKSIQLIRNKADLIEELPNYCRNGVLFADLIERLEGVFAYNNN